MTLSHAIANKPLPEVTNLQALWQCFFHEKQLLETMIEQAYQSDIPLITQICHNLFAAGGKRLRPLLTIACAQLMADWQSIKPNEAQKNNMVGLATAIEYLHAASLLHDDVIDNSDKRRGKATANALWGNEAAVLVGDFVFASAFELMTRHGNMANLALLSHTTQHLAKGQVAELVNAHNLTQSLNDYIEMVSLKTAWLFKAAAKIGAQLFMKGGDGITHQAVENIGEYGLQLGLSFQLIDDYMDYASSEGKMGKALGDDFFEGKVTFPILLLYQAASNTEQAWLETCFEAEHQRTKDEFLRIRQMMHTHHIGDENQRYAAQSVEKAIAALTNFGLDPNFEFDSGVLKLLIDFANDTLLRQA